MLRRCLTCCLSYRLPFIVIPLYGVVCAQLAHLSLGDWKDISTAHVLIIIKSEESSYFIIFFSVVVSLRFLLKYIMSLIIYTFRENRDFVYITVAQFMMSENSPISFALQIVFVCSYITPSHYHHCANLSEDIKLIKCLSDIFCRVCKFKHIPSVFSLPISHVMIERIYIICLNIIIKSEQSIIIHCLGLGHETMVCAECLSCSLPHARWLSVWISTLSISSWLSPIWLVWSGFKTSTALPLLKLR